MDRNGAWWIGLPLAGIALTIALACAAAPLPFQDQKVHSGVATCTGSNCHEASRPFANSTVLQNEYRTWQRDDGHSNAYKLLLTPAGKRIAANLGLKTAHEAPECLTCHTDYVPAAMRGRRFGLDEGVGCEACHGGAQDWLQPHFSKADHAENLALGLYPLEDPEARARVCLQCHLGSKDKPIDHNMMGAGHPPLEFEVHNFSYFQPRHFEVDKDYRSRKVYAPPAKAWATGQLIAAELLLDGLSSERLKQQGMFPELVFFDCNACHHAMRPVRWNAGVGGPLGPGKPRITDASLVMAGLVIAAITPASAAEWNASLADLHRATGESVARVRDHAQRMRKLVNAARDTLRARNLGKEQALTLLDRISVQGIERDAGDFTAAKQIYYAAFALTDELQQEHGVDVNALAKLLNEKGGELYAAINIGQDQTSSYNPEALRAALRKLRDAAAKLR